MFAENLTMSFEEVVFTQNMTIRFISVASQDYKMDVHPEYVMLGNDVLLKCSFPSFVADFVAVLSWIDSEASEYSIGTNREGNSARNRLGRTLPNRKGQHRRHSQHVIVAFPLPL